MKVLLINDDGWYSDTIEMKLAEKSYNTTIARNEEQGLLLAQSNNCDVIIVDITKSSKSGFELCKELRSHGVNIPIIMLRADDTEEDMIRGFEAGIDDYITKPFYFDELFARIRALVRRTSNSMA